MNKLIGGIALAGLLVIAGAAWQSSIDVNAAAPVPVPTSSLEFTLTSSADCPNYSSGFLRMQASSEGGGSSECFVVDIYSEYYANQLSFTSNLPAGIFSASADSNSVAIGPSPANLSFPDLISHENIIISSSVASPGTFSGTLTITASGYYLVQGEFSYTGVAESYTCGVAGMYELEVWGAQGGPSGGSKALDVGGKGGYSYAQKSMQMGEVLYVYVGGQAAGAGIGWNGGGEGSSSENIHSGGGGGTDIRTVNGAWNLAASLNSRILVAGGGGGGTAYGPNGATGGYGGGQNGQAGYNSRTKDTPTFPGYAPGGSQASGGQAGGTATSSVSGGFGYGGSNLTRNWGSGGGGGWYGGASGGYTGGIVGTGGGGSGYFLPSLISGITTNGGSSMPDPITGSTMTGRSGHGYARITYCGSSCT